MIKVYLIHFNKNSQLFGDQKMVDGMMSSAFAAAHHVDSLSRMTSMANSISPPHPHTSPGKKLNMALMMLF